jgi:selenocysteine lyase/cysteine desulfurase
VCRDQCTEGGSTIDNVKGALESMSRLSDPSAYSPLKKEKIIVIIAINHISVSQLSHILEREGIVVAQRHAFSAPFTMPTGDRVARPSRNQSCKASFNFLNLNAYTERVL